MAKSASRGRPPKAEADRLINRTVYMPKSLVDHLEKLTAESLRSFSSEVVFALRLGIRAQEKGGGV